MLPLDWLEHIWRPDPFISNAKNIAVNAALPSKTLSIERDMSISYRSK